MEKYNCPRCNGIVDLIRKPKMPTGIISLIVSCPKCKLRKVVGYATPITLRLGDRRRRLLELVETLPEGDERNQMVQEISRVEARLEDSKWML